MKSWCKYSLFTRALAITGLTGETLQSIEFDDAMTY